VRRERQAGRAGPPPRAGLPLLGRRRGLRLARQRLVNRERRRRRRKRVLRRRRVLRQGDHRRGCGHGRGFGRHSCCAGIQGLGSPTTVTVL
jgi:hypothetical protein